MRANCILAVMVAALLLASGAQAQEGQVCQNYGPQTPRDITSKSGANRRIASLAPPSTSLNLCNIHMHSNAEHKGPGLLIEAGKKRGEGGGFKCNDSSLSDTQRAAPEHGACHGVKPGDTIEVHWVYTSCSITPRHAPNLEGCSTQQCANPVLRVESQVFLVVNDPKALQFTDFAYAGNVVNGLHQPKALPADTGQPVVFVGSTTGDKYTEHACSPLQATWSVRPQCARVDINSLNTWCKTEVFKEEHAHGVRAPVTVPELLAKID